jgi:hypothetical protein
MSNECVKIALKFNKLDLLTRWIAQKKWKFLFYSGVIDVVIWRQLTVIFFNFFF